MTKMSVEFKQRTASSRRMQRGRFSRPMLDAGSGLTGVQNNSPVMDVLRVSTAHKNNDQNWKKEVLELFPD